MTVLAQRKKNLLATRKNMSIRMKEEELLKMQDWIRMNTIFKGGKYDGKDLFYIDRNQILLR